MKTILRTMGVTLAVLLFALWMKNSASARPNSQTVTLEPGSQLTLTCPTRLRVRNARDRRSTTVICEPVTVPSPTPTSAPTHTHPAPTATRVPPTATSVPPTATHVHPTATSVPPTATHVHPTATPIQGGGLAPVKPEILGSCTAAIHDRYVVAGPDGNPYRTWHPQIVPVDSGNPGGPSCAFAHEHGDDPATSLANSAPPPFGYVGALAGMDEAHEGFKVFVANRGLRNDEGRTAQTSTRFVAHMGTGGVKRFTMPHHSLVFDLVSPTGHFVHVMGMAETGLAGSICDRDASLGDNDPSNDIGRAVVTLPGTGCDLQSLYEIWLFQMNLADKVIVHASTAAFDPITVMNPNDPNQLIRTADAFPGWGAHHGCDREGYHGPVYWYNRSGPTVFYTDAHGNPGGSLRQVVSAHNAIGIPMSNDQTQFKYRESTCAPGLGLFN